MKQRILTAIIALIIFIPLIIYGNWPFIIFGILLATIGLMELLRMANLLKYIFPSTLSFLYLWLVLFQVQDHIIPVISYTTINISILFVFILLAYTVLSKNRFTFSHVGTILIATLYISIGFYFLIYIRLEGLQYILFVLFIIWATDTGAYFCGRFFGKRKLWPHISPNKTIEGAVGGLIIALLTSIIFQIVYPFDEHLITMILVALLTSVVGQIGDLVASAYKRHFNVKDSGTLLPGHGGILDRLDSLLFVLPILYIIQFI